MTVLIEKSCNRLDATKKQFYMKLIKKVRKFCMGQLGVDRWGFQELRTKYQIKGPNAYKSVKGALTTVGRDQLNCFKGALTTSTLYIKVASPSCSRSTFPG